MTENPDLTSDDEALLRRAAGALARQARTGPGTEPDAHRMVLDRARRVVARRVPALRVVALVTLVVAVAIAAPLTVELSGTRTTSDRTSTTTTSPTANTTTTTEPPPTTTTTLPPLLTGGDQGTRADIPWSEVGIGWVLALWEPNGVAPVTSPVPVATRPTQTLVLVDPTGGRYLLQTLPAGEQLLDWSADGSDALLYRASTAATTAVPTTLMVLDLATGAQTTIAVAGTPFDRFTQPDGTAVLVHAAPLQRYGLTGSLQLTYPTSYANGTVGISHATLDIDPNFAESPNGTQIAIDVTGGVDLIGNTGQLIRTVPDPSGLTQCTVARWWQGTSILVSCFPSNGLWVLPLTGAAPSELAKTFAYDAWSLPGATLVGTGGCGLWIDQLTATGSLKPLVPPGYNPNDGHDSVDGIEGTLALMQVRLPCLPRGLEVNVIEWFNPVTGAATTVLGGSTMPGYVFDAVAWGGRVRT